MRLYALIAGVCFVVGILLGALESPHYPTALVVNAVVGGIIGAVIVTIDGVRRKGAA